MKLSREEEREREREQEFGWGRRGMIKSGIRQREYGPIILHELLNELIQFKKEEEDEHTTTSALVISSFSVSSLVGKNLSTQRSQFKDPLLENKEGNY